MRGIQLKGMWLVLFAVPGIARAADFQHALIIIADDLGTDKVSSYAVDVTNPLETRPSTPNMDLMAAAGVRFSDAWATPVCSPTRAMLYSGDYPFRNGIGDIISDSSTLQMSLEADTLPQLAADAGMATALFGKSHIGEGTDTPSRATLYDKNYADFPIQAGFDWFQGNTDGAVTSYKNWLYMKSIPSSTMSSGYATSATQNRTTSPTDQTTDDALSWLNARAAEGSRHLAVVSYHLPHSTGLVTDPSWSNAVTSCGGTASSDQTVNMEFTVQCLDTELAQLLAGVPDLDDTLVVFLGDNGTDKRVTEGFFDDDRGKSTQYESGIRVPFVLADGAAIKDAIDNGGVLPTGGVYRVDAGSTSADPASVVDIYATVADYLDLSSSTCIPGDNCARDSVTLRSVLTGGAPARTTVVSENYDIEASNAVTGDAAVRIGDFKLIVHVASTTRPCRSYTMYDLATDRWENTNLFDNATYASEQAELLAAVEDLADEMAGEPTDWLNHADCDACAATEVWYDGFDDSCDDASDYDQDLDGVEWPDDCIDTDATAYPGAPDAWYDGIDSNCDGDSDFDQDQDGSDTPTDCDDTDPDVGPHATEVWYDGADTDCAGDSDFDQDGDGVDLGADCDDTRADVGPGAPDAPYDGLDANCLGDSDYDADGDGYDAALGGGSDCDDSDAAVHPGAVDAPYDGRDGDCAGDDDYDADRDGDAPVAYGGTDCDDASATVHVGAADAWYDGIDSNCAGDSDFDQDGDSFDAPDDCDDTNPAVWPGAVETSYDAIDADCLGDSDFDADGDGFDSGDWGGTDCDDFDAGIWPGAPEASGDGVDSDCDGTVEVLDADGDGYTVDVDCDDSRASVHPGATEVYYDGIDEDCAGGDDYDADLDGYTPTAYGGTDCNDTSSAVHPGATDTWYDGIDSNCDGRNDYDRDGDRYPSSSYGGTDCNDGNARIKPGAREVWYDGVDSNCDGRNDYDQDGDTYTATAYGGTDCNDTRASVKPGATEIWYDGVDQNCDGANDYDRDGDGWPRDTDCNDSSARSYPGAPGWNLDCTRA